jgi:ABC-type tungstate transport system permease subunit
LKSAPDQVDLLEVKATILSKIADGLAQIQQTKGIQAVSEADGEVHNIHYPVDTYPEKIKSINLDKTPEFEGVLTGIKGQYWMLDGDRVINIRKYAGYNVNLHVG